MLRAVSDLDLTIGRRGRRIEVIDTLQDGGGDPVTCSGGTPTVANVDRIVVDADDGVFGTPGGDFWLADGDGDDVVRGGRGSDNLRVYRGRDAIFAGPGNDLQLFQFAGTESRGDRIFGGRGKDALDGRNGAPDTINCGRGRDEVLATREDTLLSCERRRFL